MHKTIVHHSMIVESLAAIHHVISKKSHDILPSSLKLEILKNPYVDYAKDEPFLLFSMFELLAFIDERKNFEIFKEKYQHLSDTELRFCLLQGRYSFEKIEATSVEDFIKEIQINDIEAYKKHFKSPKSIFDELIKICEYIFYDASFRELFTLNVMKDIKNKYQNIDLELEKRHPLSLSQSIMGKSFYNINDWTVYEFYYVYLLYPYKLRIMDENKNIMLMSLYDLEKTDEEFLSSIKKGIKLLSDPTRLNILRMIYSNPMFGKEIANELNLTTATVSHHLDALKKEGLIHIERDKNTKYFSTNQRRFNQLLSQLNDYVKKESTH